MTVVGVTKDGRVIARTALNNAVLGAAGNASMLASVTDLKKVEYVLSWNISTSGAQRVDGPVNQKIVGNSVGVTVYAGGATTVSGEVITIGF